MYHFAKQNYLQICYQHIINNAITVSSNIHNYDKGIKSNTHFFYIPLYPKYVFAKLDKKLVHNF